MGQKVKRFRHGQIIFQSLLFAAAWGFTMYMLKYPPELWAGVCVILYPTVYITRFIISLINDFALRKTVHILGLESSVDSPTPQDSFSEWHPLTFFFSIQFFLSTGYITVGISLMATDWIMRILDFPELLPSSFLYLNMIVSAVSLALIIEFHVVLHGTMFIARRIARWRNFLLSLVSQFVGGGLQVTHWLALSIASPAKT